MSVSDDKDYERYGFVGGDKDTDDIYKVDAIVEKPGKHAAPSNWRA